MYFLAAISLFVAGLIIHKIRQTLHWEELNEQDRAKMRAVIEAHPENIGAYEHLADSLRQSGRLEEACDYYRRALRFDVEETNKPVRYKLEMTLEDLQRRRTQFRSLPDTWVRNRKIAAEVLFCGQCAASNPPHRVHCENCGYLLTQRSFVEAARENWKSGAVRKWAIVAGLNAAFFFGLMALIMALSPIYAAIIAVSAFAAVCFVFLQRIDGKR